MRMKIFIAAALAVLVVVSAGEIVAETGTDTNEVYSPDLFKGMKYRMVGPSRGGRVTAVAGHRAQPSTFYMGATGGGVWKTTDYGNTWLHISDGYFATGSIGAIRVADSDPNVVYVGTGSDGLRSNVIIGKGVYRSTDAGKTWNHVGLENIGNIGAVLIHPKNPDLVYVAAIGNPFAPNPERGVFRTKDGGVHGRRSSSSRRRPVRWTSSSHRTIPNDLRHRCGAPSASLGRSSAAAKRAASTSRPTAETTGNS